MIKMKTAELSGAALDWAVAQCEGISVRNGFDDNCPEYATNWAQGGPIIEREQIAIYLEYQDSWAATDGNCRMPGDTPLIAAMRCYVASKLGDEVDVPVELL